MKLLVVLESHFYVDQNGEVWCDRVIDYNFLKRYLNVFEEVIVCGRTDKENDDKYKLKVTGKNVSFYKLPNFYGIKGLLTNYFKINKLLKKYVKDVDAVLYRVPTPLSLFTYKQVLRCNKVLAIEFMISADKMVEGKGLVNKIINDSINNIAKKICLKANGVSYVTEYTLQQKYPCKAIIQRSNSESYFTASYSTIELDKKNINKQQWNKNNKPKVFHIIHTGYMDTYRKGQHILIKSLKKIRDNGYDVDLTLIGDGNKKKEFEKLAKDLNVYDYVNFLGLVKDKKIIFENLSKSHILAFPTEAEGLPRTIIEAMASGLPCISSPVDGIPELLDKEYLVNCNDINGYSQKIMYLIDNWEKMIKIGESNYNKAKMYEKTILDRKRNEFYINIYNLCKKNRNVRK